MMKIKFLAPLLVAVLVFAGLVRADDLGNGSWSETDGSNTAASPNGWPTGITGAGAVNSGRAMMGALKRAWDRINPTVTTTGSANAYVYTPSNASFPTALVTGECYSFKANFANTSTATLAVNGLTAKNLFKQGGSGPLALIGGEIQTNQMVTACYDGTQFQITSALANGSASLGASMTLIQCQTASASNTIAFTGIAASYDQLEVRFSGVVPTTSADNFAMQFGVGGTPTWNTGASYTHSRTTVNSSAATTIFGAGGANGLPITTSMNSTATLPIGGRVTIHGYANTAVDHGAVTEWQGFLSDSVFYSGRGAGIWTADQTALTAIRFFATSSAGFALTADTIASGKFCLYGINITWLDPALYDWSAPVTIAANDNASQMARAA